MGTTFKTLRLRAGLTCTEIAESIGVKEGTIKKYECSSRVPSLSKIYKLEKALKCNNNEFMEAYSYHRKQNLMKNKNVEGIE